MHISKWIYSFADYIAVSSSKFINYFKETIRINRESILHLPQYAEELSTVKVEVEVGGGNQFNFVFSGNIEEMQSVETIVKGAYELRNHTTIPFHIVGYGSKFEDCKLLSEKLALHNIIFIEEKL